MVFLSLWVASESTERIITQSFHSRKDFLNIFIVCMFCLRTVRIAYMLRRVNERKPPMDVISLSKAECEEFVLKKHYSRRASIFWAGFGLVEDGRITGVCVFGQPSPPIQKHAFKDRDFKLYELSRLVVQSGTKNAASFLVARALAMLPPPCAVVSYADMEQSHCGIIYQATNWLYTGATVSHDKMYIVDGKRTHPMSLRDRGITAPGEWAKANGISTVKPLQKHRYFFLVGNKYQKRGMLGKLAYAVVPEYPKCDQRRYDDGPDLKMAAPLSYYL
jgi:hypothetical protein